MPFITGFSSPIMSVCISQERAAHADGHASLAAPFAGALYEVLLEPCLLYGLLLAFRGDGYG